MPTVTQRLRRRGGRTLAALAVSAPGRAWSMRKLRRLAADRPSVRLHLGCGPRLLPGWINIDIGLRADVTLDLRRPIPLPDDSVDFVFTEDFIEHLPYAAGVAVLSECARLLHPGGVLRLATPDLARFAVAYTERSERALAWYRQEFPGLVTHAEMFNTGMRAWGHQFLYDEETMRGVLESLGFDVGRVEFGRSDHDAFQGLELRDAAEGAASMYFEATVPPLAAGGP
jgi:predicted SAM-dependent methyltransferase